MSGLLFDSIILLTHHTNLTMGTLRCLSISSLLSIIISLFSTFGWATNDNLPIKIQWASLSPEAETASKVHFGNLHESSIEDMFSHYRKLNTEEVKNSVKNGFLLSGGLDQLSGIEERKKEVLKKFIHLTIDSVSSNYNYSDCGITAEDGSLKLKYCPGIMTVITLNHIGIYSCSSIKSLTVYGPVIIKSQRCSEQILSRGSCQLAANLNYLDNDCHLVTKDPINNHFLIGFLILLLINIFLLVVFFSSFSKWKKLKQDYSIKIKKTGIELTNYSRFDSEIGMTITKDQNEIEELMTTNCKKLSWFKILMVLCFCKPMPIESYELLDSQMVNSNLFKYTLTLASTETIEVGPKYIKFSNSDSTSRLVHLFSTYDWEIEFEDKYYCLQSGCNEKLICRQDLLPFVRSDEVIGDEFPTFKGRINYYSCKNMMSYCAFASGCFIMAFSLKLEEHKKYEVYKISQQSRISREVILPPGCYLDEYSPSRSSGVDEMYYVENKDGFGWFCHPTTYSHYPLPHSLGDLKVGLNNTVNFISDFMNCATDRWRDVYCTKPDSFISHLDEHCVRNQIENTGLTINRMSDSLSWPSNKLETIKISCDRDLKLIQSDHHCTEIQIEVWDTGNVQSDLLMSIFANSHSGVGVYILPDSVHSESHHFGCNGVWHNTFLYDIHSLNSSGIPYRFHTNIKQLINEDSKGIEIKPINEDHWYNVGLGKWFSSFRGWFTGFSGASVIMIGVIGICILRR
uniref:Uncharacterized protein n=1 Tax=Pararge aegeria TaxID=116150 RepID=S4PN08_9NEOP